MLFFSVLSGLLNNINLLFEEKKAIHGKQSVLRTSSFQEKYKLFYRSPSLIHRKFEPSIELAGVHRRKWPESMLKPATPIEV